MTEFTDAQGFTRRLHRLTINPIALGVDGHLVVDFPEPDPGFRRLDQSAVFTGRGIECQWEDQALTTGAYFEIDQIVRRQSWDHMPDTILDSSLPAWGEIYRRQE